MAKLIPDDHFTPDNDRLDRFFRIPKRYRLLKTALFTTLLCLAVAASAVSFTPQRIARFHTAMVIQSRNVVGELRLVTVRAQSYVKSAVPPELALPMLQILGCWSVQVFFGRPKGSEY